MNFNRLTSIFARNNSDLCPRLPADEILRRPNRSSWAHSFAAKLDEARLNSSSAEADSEARIPLDATDSVHRRGTFPCAAISWHRSDLSVPAGYCSVITMIIRRLAHTTLAYDTPQIICDTPCSRAVNDRSRGVRFKRPLSLNSGRIAEAS